MEYVLSKFKLRPGKEELARTFLSQLHSENQQAMVEVLKEAKMTLDCSFIDGDYLYIFKRIEDHDYLADRVQNSQLKIYDAIREWVGEVIESGENITAVAAFDTI